MRKAITQIFSGNLISKGLGLSREVITAALFGTGQAIGAFRIAQTGTLVPVNFFTSDSLNSAFIPLYKKYNKQSKDLAQTLLWALLSIFSIVSLSLASILFLLAPGWVGILAPGLDAYTAALAATLLKIMGLGIPFYIISAILMFLAMANNDFVPMAFRPSVQNIGMIIGVVLAYIFNNPVFFAWGFTGSYIVLASWSFFRAFSSESLSFPLHWEVASFKEVLISFWNTLKPLLLLPVVLQGNIVVERIIASLIGVAVISSLDYAKFITETVILLLSVPVAFAGLASWSELDADEIRDKLKNVIAILMMIAVPGAAFLGLQAHLIASVIYERGLFDSDSVKITGDILRGISYGLWAQVIGYVLLKALNAQLKNSFVLIIMSVALSGSMLVNFLGYKYLGATILGISNSFYGLAIFVGCMIALNIWKEVILSCWPVVPGVASYCILSRIIPPSDEKWLTLFVNILFSGFYWAIFLSFFSSVRSFVLGAFNRNSV